MGCSMAHLPKVPGALNKLGSGGRCLRSRRNVPVEGGSSGEKTPSGPNLILGIFYVLR